MWKSFSPHVLMACNLLILGSPRTLEKRRISRFWHTGGTQDVKTMTTPEPLAPLALLVLLAPYDGVPPRP